MRTTSGALPRCRATQGLTYDAWVRNNPSSADAVPLSFRARLKVQLQRRYEQLMREVAKFGVIGIIAYVIDVGIMNILRFAGGDGPLYAKPLTSKIIATIVATTFAYFGNRFWTFRHRGGTTRTREYLLFFFFNGVALGISLVCLWFSHYILNLTSPLADNISANVIGLILGTLFRFWSYRRWVFPAVAASAKSPQTPVA